MQEIPCTVTIAAKGEDIQKIEQSCPGIDLVCVIDTSGSMRGEKIDLVRKTLMFVLTRLTEFDRLSLISFNNDAYKLCRLIACNAQGILELQTHISAL